MSVFRLAECGTAAYTHRAAFAGISPVHSTSFIRPTQQPHTAAPHTRREPHFDNYRVVFPTQVILLVPRSPVQGSVLE